MADGPAPRNSNLAPKDHAADQSGSDELSRSGLLNSMLGEFRILRRLGRGGMAEVYLAEQTSLQRNVAIKVLRKELLQDESHIKRFKTEALAAAGLTHPNIVQVYMVGEEGGHQYIVQEYVKGLNLRELLTRKGPPQIPLAVHILKQVASALQAAAAAGIVHRDIKPENIMITAKGEVKVADFGLAQLTQSGERVNLTQVGITMGTPLYMSPEQVHGSKLDQRSDIYSLGVTAYHLLTGEPPFRGDTALSVAIQHLNTEPPPIETKRPDLPPAFRKVIHKMMAKKVEDRYQDAQSVLKDLKRVLSQERGAMGLAGEVEEPEFVATSPSAPPTQPSAPTPVPKGASWPKRLFRKLWTAADRPWKTQVLAFSVWATLLASIAAGIGWATRLPDPLRPNLPRKSATVKRGSAAEQFVDALAAVDNEEAWQAVIQNFPNEKAYRRRAEQELALLYLVHRRFDDAQMIFDEFAGYSDVDRNLRTFGLAGQAILDSLQGEYHDSQKKLDAIWPAYQNLDARLKELVKETTKRNQKQLNGQVKKEWRELFREEEKPPAPSDSD